MKIAVLTDSASNVSKEFIKKHKNLFVVPLMIVVDGREFRDQAEITALEVYEKLDSSIVSTSLPLNSDLTETIKDIKKQEFTDIIAINISSGLSGTFNSFRLVLEKEKDINIIHFDSKTLGGQLGFLVEYALELIENKTPIEKFVPMLENFRFNNSIAFYTINTLKYLKRGGRIGKVEGTIGDILHIKPIITVNDDEGVYVTLSKAFGMKRSLIRMKNILQDMYKEDLIDVIVHFGNNDVEAEDLMNKLKSSSLNIRNISLQRLTPVLGVHTGPDMIAYVARRVELKSKKTK
jgi:DegV family protein with EDD domain